VTVGNTVLICTDRSRRLPVHDPCERELLIACASFTIYTEIGYEVDEAEVLFWGLCPDCQQEDSRGNKELFA